MKRIFEVTWTGSCVIKLDQNVIDAVDDEWRKVLYPLHTPEEIARHIAYNMVFNHAMLTDLDGWADQSDEMAELCDEEWESENVVEIKI